jgi:integrase
VGWLWRLRTQYDGAPTKTDTPRDVPIHPLLREALIDWRANGFVQWTCRAATVDDFVIPRSNGKLQHRNTCGAKVLKRDAIKVGIDPTGRDFHSFRRSFVTQLRTDGAPADRVERITHNARGAMIDVYTFFGFEELFEVVDRYSVVTKSVTKIPDTSFDAMISD